MRKSQNNPDQSGFHLSAAHVDVQPVLLMAVLEENKTTAFVTEAIPHIRAQPQVLSKKNVLLWGPSNNIYSFFHFLSTPGAGTECHYIISPARSFSCLSGSPGAPRPMWTSPLTHRSAPRAPFSHQPPKGNLEGASFPHAWITTDCLIQSVVQLQGQARLNSSPCHERRCK